MILRNRCIRLALLLGSQVAFTQVATLQGTWNAEFKDSIGTGTGSVSLTLADSTSLTGNYRTNLSGEGTVAVRPQGNGYKFILTQTTKDCTGSFVGEFGLADGKITGTYSGTDCKGWHDNGEVSMIRQSDKNALASPQSTASRDSGYVKCGGFDYVIVWLAPRGNKIVAKLSCNEPVTIASGASGGFTKIITKSNREGYVAENLVVQGNPPAGGEAPVVVKEVPAETVFKTPSRMPTSPSRTHEHKLTSEEYSLSIRVLQTEQVPYSVQYGGGGISTNCSISGSTYTYGSATSLGDYTYGHATSDTNLSMHCNTYENQPMQWQHVLNAMLVVASNGNAYIIACDAAWRWSKCRGLVTGDTFRAKMTSKGLAVEYLLKGKPKEATYSILQAKVLGQ